ncbi:NADPH-dependent FMN reductase [Maritimibacter sp. 55A14]|uniref:NADPH-dependent FMN reductase n=1 Tax=Maritimibacter sp. 55A14 TaxID=2174844 RepID=UPI000D6143D9|nr:NAD(P)H-dependent oxidoreductase [Maritimibacter sp. 55A14]PWE32402.1 NADPH-dependent FMN reductase [Maritimibacter sp. 55A14]
MATGRLLGISGSLRRDSYNTKLMREAARLFEPAEFTEADLNLPLYDGDLESEKGIPEPVQTLIDQIKDADAIVISTPEYNKAPSGVLKNALDWTSRTRPFPLIRKPVAIMSATAGRAGGERTQFALRLMLVAFQPRLLQGPEVLVGQNTDQFDDKDRLVNEINAKALDGLMKALRAEAGLSED